MAGVWIAQFKDADNADYLVNVNELVYTKTVGNNTQIVLKEDRVLDVKGNIEQIIDELIKVAIKN